MSPSSIVRCLFVLAIASVGECAPARNGELLVREGNGRVPCFTVSEEEEKRGGAPDFHAIMVNEAGGKTALWSMAMPGARTFALSFRMCIPYAGRLPVLPQTPAATLVAGKIYEVSIEVRRPVPVAAPRSYRARFCLAEQGDGALRVRAVAAVGVGNKVHYLCST